MNLKKITTIALATIISSTVMFSQVHADTNKNDEMIQFNLNDSKNQSFSITQNEYEMIKELRNKSNEELEKSGYSKEQINDLYNYEENFKVHIDELNLMSDEELENFNYTNDQINRIRNFSGSEQEIAPLAATIDNQISKNSSTCTESKSTLNIKVRFVWSGVPTFQFNDMYAVVNGEGMYYDKEYTPFTTTYKGTNGSQKTYSGSLKRYGAGNSGADIKFPVYRNEVVKYYISSGSANIGLNKSSKVTQCGIGASYGHSTISLGISVTYPASIGISFNSGVTSTYKSNVYSL